MKQDDDADPTDDAARLFREAMKDVRRLPAGKRARDTLRPRPPGRAAGARTPSRPARATDDGDESSATPAQSAPMMPAERGEALEYRAPGVRPSVLRGLRRGQYPVEGGVDLHGLTTSRAQRVLQAFMDEAREVRARCVRVVHGKGIGSGERGPVLKSLVNGWLREQQDVLAFVSAPPEDGGTGAVYVLLRKPAPPASR